METQGSSSGTPEGGEPETVSNEAETVVQPPAAAAAGGGRLDRFGRGSIAAVAAIAGIVVGAGGTMALDDDRDGWRHHGPGWHHRGGWGDGEGPRGPMMGGPRGGQGYGPGPGYGYGPQGAPPAPQGQGNQPVQPQGGAQGGTTTPQQGNR